LIVRGIIVGTGRSGLERRRWTAMEHAHVDFVNVFGKRVGCRAWDAGGVRGGLQFLDFVNGWCNASTNGAQNGPS
jgi:hypothetical protein